MAPSSWVLLSWPWAPTLKYIPLKQESLMKEFRKLGSKKYAEHSLRFFKTGKGEYGEGDLFLGIRVPVTRQFAKEQMSMPLSEVKKLARSKYHEERLLALIIIMYKYKKADEVEQERLYKAYLSLFKY